MPKPSFPPSAKGGSSKTMWLISFTDLVSLLLGFFVMLYAMTEPQGGRWVQMVKGMSARSTATTHSDRTPEPTAAFNGALIETHSRINLDYLSVLLRSQLKELPEFSTVSVRREDDRVVIFLPGDVLFDRNAFAIGERGRRALFLLAPVVERIGDRIEVVGRAGGGPDARNAAWELALARAVAVAGQLRTIGYGADLVARASAGGGQAPDPGVDVVVRDQEG